MLGVMRATCQVLGVKQLCTSVYHLQTNSLVERLNGTLKRMLHQCTQRDPQKWDLLITPLLFALGEAPQSSAQFSPFELVYGHKPWGLMQI